MNTKIILSVVLIALFGMAHHARADAPCVLTMTVKGLTTKGVLHANVCDSEAGFKKRQPVTKLSKKIQIDSSGDQVLQFELPPGVYSIALFLDTNDNGKLDFRFGRPKEMVGMTNNPRKMGPPSWKDGAFRLNQSANTVVTLYSK